MHNQVRKGLFEDLWVGHDLLGHFSCQFSSTYYPVSSASIEKEEWLASLGNYPSVVCHMPWRDEVVHEVQLKHGEHPDQQWLRQQQNMRSIGDHENSDRTARH